MYICIQLYCSMKLLLLVIEIIFVIKISYCAQNSLSAGEGPQWSVSKEFTLQQIGSQLNIN